MKKTFHIALSSDNNYAAFLATTIASMVDNAKEDEKLCVYVLDGGLDEKNKLKIEQLKKIRDFSITYLRVDERMFADCPPLEGCPHTTVATYYRFLLPELLPELEKVLYLDCDIIVRKSLAELWETDVTGWAAAVIENAGGDFVTRHKRKIGHKDEELYFNAGVMLLNMERMRRDYPARVLLQKRQELNEMGVFDYGDQDTLNYALKGKVKEISRIFNLQEGFFQEIRHDDKKTLEEIAETTVVAHFTGGAKPDKMGCGHSLRWEWFRYLKMAGYYSWKHAIFYRMATLPRWLVYYKHTAYEIVLQCLKLSLVKIKLGESFALRILGIRILEAFSKKQRLRLKLLGIRCA